LSERYFDRFAADAAEAAAAPAARVWVAQDSDSGRPCSPRASCAPASGFSQFKALETDVNFLFNLVPTFVRTVMQTTEIRAAMRPYSMAVAPLSQRKKLWTKLRILSSP
jgi:hypothetical protein